MSATRAGYEPRYRVVAYVLDGEYRATGDMGYRSFTSAFIGSSGEQYAVVQRSDGPFQIIDLWETTENGSGKIYPSLCEEFDDEDAAVVATCMRNI